MDDIEKEREELKNEEIDIKQEIEDLNIYTMSLDEEIQYIKEEINKIKNKPILSEEALEKLKILFMIHRLERIGNTEIYLFDSETIKEIKKILNLP